MSALAVVVTACGTNERHRDRDRLGDEIVVDGTLVSTGTPVVLWTDPGGYDAGARFPRFRDPDPAKGRDRARRFGSRPGAASGAPLRDVDQFVVHYDVCGSARQCFRILHDVRSLSVHFLLDVDGTIYQTLDVAHRAWHAGTANDRSIGVEIAHIGAYPAPGHPTLRSWYASDDGGTRVTFPRWLADPGIRTPSFVARPAREGLVDGVIHGRRYWQYDFTPQQYDALARLLAALHRTLPDMALDVPRRSDGTVRDDALDDAERKAWRGLLAHWHVTRDKQDPGPAFDWDRVLQQARRIADVDRR